MPKTTHGFIVGHSREWQGQVDTAKLLDQSSHQTINHPNDIVAIHKRHFHVQLGELGLSVRAEILISKTSSNLHVAVVAGDHHDLFVKLRGLGQGVEGPRMNSARNEVIPSTFGRASAQNGCLNIDELVLFEVVPHRLDDLAAKFKRRLHATSTKIEVAMLQAKIFTGHLWLAR